VTLDPADFRLDSLRVNPVLVEPNRDLVVQNV
jgi:hypothetical protein